MGGEVGKVKQKEGRNHIFISVRENHKDNIKLRAQKRNGNKIITIKIVEKQKGKKKVEFSPFMAKANK